jgi:hypothetical protein
VSTYEIERSAGDASGAASATRSAVTNAGVLSTRASASTSPSGVDTTYASPARRTAVAGVDVRTRSPPDPLEEQLREAALSIIFLARIGSAVAGSRERDPVVAGSAVSGLIYTLAR